MIISGTGPTGANNSWIQFMKLAEEARVRNSGLISTTKKSQECKTNAFPGLPISQARSGNQIVFNASTQDVKKKIIGGQFDAYA